jgi:hypothetical protein
MVVLDRLLDFFPVLIDGECLSKFLNILSSHL